MKLCANSLKVSLFFQTFLSLAADTAEVKPKRGITVKIDVFGHYNLLCSYCAYTCLFPPDIIEEAEEEALKKHVCKRDFSACNVFICKRYLLFYGAISEMYLADDAVLICYKCLKHCKKNHHTLKPCEEFPTQKTQFLAYPF